MDNLLNVDQLSVWYPTRRKADGERYFKAVNGVSFNVERGKTLGMVGESGSGKSTIGRAIVRLAPIRSGTIELNGDRIETLKNSDLLRIRKRIQMVFQDPSQTLNPRMTVGALLEEPLKIHFKKMDSRMRKDRILSLLNRVGLASHSIGKYPHQFSGGQRQRISIARAMTVDPELIICDEAVSALDVSVQAQIVNLLQDLQEEFGYSYLFIGHDLAIIEHMSHQVVVLEKGLIVEQGDADRICSRPSHPYTRRLLDAVPALPSLRA